MNCSEAMELISSRLDGVLSPEEDEKLSAHLAQCAQCRAVAQELSQLNFDLAALSCEPPKALHEGVMRQVRRKSRRRKDQRAVLRFAGAMAAAAAVLAVLAGLHLVSLPGFGAGNASVSMVELSAHPPAEQQTLFAQAEQEAARLSEATGQRVLVISGYSPEAARVEDAALSEGLSLYALSAQELEELERTLAGTYEMKAFGEADAAQTQGYLLCVDES